MGETLTISIFIIHNPQIIFYLFLAAKVFYGSVPHFSYVSLLHPRSFYILRGHPGYALPSVRKFENNMSSPIKIATTSMGSKPGNVCVPFGPRVIHLRPFFSTGS